MRELLIQEKDGIPEDASAVSNAFFHREVVIPAGTQDHLETLKSKPGVEPIDVSRISLEAVACVSTVDEHIAFQDAEVFVFSMGVADHYDPHVDLHPA